VNLANAPLATYSHYSDGSIHGYILFNQTTSCVLGF
jgi:hypothetical protein